MQIDRQEIVNLLRAQGDYHNAAKAETQLPDKVDHEQHRGLLGELGVNPDQLLSRFT